MVDFCKEPEKECQKDPIGELDLKIDQYYSSIYSKLFTHINDTSVHVTQEEKDAWNEKASKDALKELQDQLNKLIGDEDDSVKGQLSKELKGYINTIISSLDVNSFAKKEDITGLVSHTDLADYAQKDWCNKTFVKIGNSSSSSLDNYYTKSDVDKLINDYSIKKFAFRDNALTIVQNGKGGESQTFITEIEGGTGGVSLEQLDTKLNDYIKSASLHNVILNGRVYNLSTDDIIINTSSKDGTDGENGSTYTPYFQNNNSWQTAPTLPDDYKSPDQASTEEGSKWATQATIAGSGEYTWVTYVTIDTNGLFGKWLTPVCLTGHSEDQQKLVGSPLRNRGEWDASSTYYDGYTTQTDGAFWQDYVSYTVDGVANYYICVYQNSGQQPGASGSENYWSLLSYSDGMLTNNIIAKKGDIGELSANEIIIKNDSNAIVAGITSGKSTNVSGQGDVRIWAGSTSGDNIASAPFTVTESGSLKASDVTITGGSVGGITIKDGQIGIKEDYNGIEITKNSFNYYRHDGIYTGSGYVSIDNSKSSLFSVIGHGGFADPIVRISKSNYLGDSYWSTALQVDGNFKLQGHINYNVTFISGEEDYTINSYNNPCGLYVYNGTTNGRTIYLPGSTDSETGETIIICNESNVYVNIAVGGSEEFWVNGYMKKQSSYSLELGSTITAVYTGNAWHIW